MKRLILLFLCLFFATSAMAGQGSGAAAPAKPKAKAKATVDCASADDSKITADVKAKFAKSSSLKDLTVDVATSQGEVTITGTVKTGLQKGSATRMAKAVPCVKKVVNNLKVEGAKKVSK